MMVERFQLNITDEITSAIVNEDPVGVIAVEEFSEVESKN